MTIPQDGEDWYPSTLTGSDSSLTGTSLSDGSSTWSSGTSTSSVGPHWSDERTDPGRPQGATKPGAAPAQQQGPPADLSLPSTVRAEPQTSLRLDSIAAPHAQGPVSARIGRELLGDLGAPPGRTAQHSPSPRSPDADGPAATPLPAAPPAMPPPAMSPPAASPGDSLRPSGSSPQASVAEPYAPEQPQLEDPSTWAGPPPATGRGPIRSLADLERAKQRYEREYGASSGRPPTTPHPRGAQGHRSAPVNRARSTTPTSSRRNGAYSALLLGLLAAGVVLMGGVNHDPAPNSGIFVLAAVSVLTGLVTVAKPKHPQTRNRVVALIGMVIAVGVVIVHLTTAW